MINTIIFDCFGVLTADSWRAFVDGLPPEVDKVRLRELNRQLDIGLLSRDDFLTQVQDVSGRRPKEVETLVDNEITKNEPLLALIRDLKDRGFKIGMISNISTNWIRESLLSREEQSLFDDMVFSYEVGLAKPDERIFELACRRLSVQPRRVLFIDDVERYCSAAESIGMKSICYEEFDSFQKQLNDLIGGGILGKI